MSEMLGISPLEMSGNLAENWKFWVQKFQNYLVASETIKKSEELQCAQLRHYIGDEGLRIFNTFEIEADKKGKIGNLIEKFTEYFTPKTNLVYQRHKFLTRKQTQGETTQYYVTELKNLAKNCKWGEIENDLICNVLICGLISEKLRKRLLEDSEMKLDKAIRVCLSVEESQKQNQEISEKGEIGIVRARQKCSGAGGYSDGKSRAGEKVWKTKKGSNNSKTTKCQRCGYNHEKKRCPAYTKQCSECGAYGHFKKMCFKRSVYAVENEIKEVFVGLIGKKQKKNSCREWSIVMRVERKKEIKIKLDTGAMVNVISQSTLKSLGFDLEKMENINLIITNFTHKRVPVLVKCKLCCTFQENNYVLEFCVVRDECPTILGINSCIQLNLIKRVDNISCNRIVESYNDVFKGIGCLRDPYTIKLKSSISPVVHAPRKVPFALVNKFKACLEKMDKEGIISKVDYPTEWVNPIVLVHKPDRTLRICLDTRNLNQNICREHYQLPTFEELTSKLAGAKVFSTLDAMSGFWQIPLDKESSDLCTFSTPFGRYKILRLPFGLTCAPEVFHKKFKEIFEIPGVEIYIDDILIYANNQTEHDRINKNIIMIGM
ncbi:uncharacterized protein LOC135125945 [Zophobas morio]|uniref:uncharacterized protein LOC135125945 n=1 Tax=Zophobas morio TaxID=2755281 RepID=UPI0030836A67